MRAGTILFHYYRVSGRKWQRKNAVPPVFYVIAVVPNWCSDADNSAETHIDWCADGSLPRA
jgi:hypothetical protein